MGIHDEGGWLSKVWVCCCCGWRGAAGSMKFIRKRSRLQCPKCQSCDTHPLEEGMLQLSELEEIQTEH
jgi:hypothetical protein